MTAASTKESTVGRICEASDILESVTYCLRHSFRECKMSQDGQLFVGINGHCSNVQRL